MRENKLINIQAAGVRGALSCLTYDAARVWPYKLVAHLLEKVVSRGVHLHTLTPVSSVSRAPADKNDHRWVVNTARGSVKANTVVYATNGYTSALVPEMKDKIVPVRGMVARLAGKDAPKLKDSYLMRFSEHEYDYMIPRPDGSIILGGARRDFFKDLGEWFDVTDDSKLMEGARGYFDGYMQRHFLGWENSGVHTEEIWTGSKSLDPNSAEEDRFCLTLSQSWATPTTGSLTLVHSLANPVNICAQVSLAMGCRKSSSLRRQWLR